jgi:hypothetical protein
MDMYSTQVLNGVVASLIRPPSWLLDRYFPSIVTFDTEEVEVDVLIGARRMAPLVSPLVAGKIVADQSFSTNSIKPAYVKDKRVFDAVNGPFKRIAGEKIGGSLSPEDRVRARLATSLADQVAMIARRKEWMACSAMRDGKITLVGDQYPSRVVDFQRKAAFTSQLLTTARWGQTGVKPLDLLKTWAMEVLQESGIYPTDVVLDVDAWTILSADTSFIKVLDTRFVGGNSVDNSTSQIEGGIFKGSVESFNFYVYAGWYVDDAGATQPLLGPSGTVIMASPAMEGEQLHGAIKDLKALQPFEVFTKSWEDEDPSVRYLLTQSAPITNPRRPNATRRVNVLGN